MRAADLLNYADATVSAEARAGWLRCIKRDGTLRRGAPDWRKDPHAWQAWQGYWTSLGRHTEGATFKLMMIDPAQRGTWEQIMRLVDAAREAINPALNATYKRAQSDIAKHVELIQAQEPQP